MTPRGGKTVSLQKTVEANASSQHFVQSDIANKIDKKNK